MMRKFSFLTIMFLGLTFVWSCSGSGESANPVETDSATTAVEAVIDSAEADTIAMLMGALIGNDYAINLNHSKDDPMGVDRDDFLRGMKVALSADNHSASYTEGVRAAVEIIKEMERFADNNVALDRARVLSAIERRLRADTVTENDIAEANSTYNHLLQRIYSADIQ